MHDRRPDQPSTTRAQATTTANRAPTPHVEACMWTDLRLAWRSAVRRPGFTLLVALTLALGLGVNSAVFALVDAVLLRPLPYRDPSRLVFVWQTLPQQNMFEVEATPFDYLAWRGLQSVSSIAMSTFGSFTLTGGTAEPERVRGARITASMMPTLGIAPAIGRGFASSEDFDDAPPVAILSQGLWRRRFGGDPAIVGRTIDIDGAPRTVVGVMPGAAMLPGAPAEDNELWLPMRMSPAERINEISHNYTIVARLADRVALPQASAELEALSARLAAERPSHGRIGARMASVEERTTRPVRPALLVAAASVALLLVVAAANASTLLIARAASRRHELAVRAALGASRARLLSLALAESLVFSSIGAAAGLVLGGWALQGLVPLFAAALPPSVAVNVDSRAALFTASVAVAIGMLFGIVSARRPADRVVESLAAGGARSSASVSVGRTRNVLVVAQVALAVVLLSAAGLMMTTIGRLSRVSPGFAADHLLTFRVALLGQRYSTAPARAAFVSDMLQRFASVPGTTRTAAASVVPFGGTRNATVVEIEGRQEAAGSRAIVDQRYVSSSYFQTMKIPLVGGRSFREDDDSRSERVTLINRTMMKQYFPNQNPVNQRIRATAGFEAGVWLRIVGVVDDVRHIALSRDAVPEMYHPIAQTAVSSVTIVLRTVGDPAAMVPAARTTVRAADPDLPIYDVRTMDDRIAASFSQTRAAMLLLLVTSTLAAALAGVAIYGAIWYSVVQRTQELGIRVALGATRALVFREVIGGAMLLASIGAVVGAAGGIAGGSLLRGFLFDTTAADPATYGAVIAGVLAFAVAASIVPAIRAARVDPITALRAN